MRSIARVLSRGKASAAAACGAALTIGAVSAALAFPEGAPWEAAGGEGCAECHFDAPPQERSPALEVLGLPSAPLPGERYLLTVRLEDERMVTAGFLLSAWQGAARTHAAGAFEVAADGETGNPTVETNGALARSTEAGLQPTGPGVAEWSVVWQAPEHIADIELEVWANAGNDDKSPFGDATHKRVFRLADGVEHD